MRLSFHVSISSSTSYYYHALSLSLYICITILAVVLFLLLSAHAFSLLQRFQRRFFSRESCGVVVLSIRVFVIQHDEIAIRDVESAQLFQRGFGVVNVLVHHVRGTLRRPRVPDANLTYRAVFAEDVVDVLVGNAEGQIADVQNAIDLGRELFVREKRYVRWRRRLFLRGVMMMRRILTTTNTGTLGGLHFSLLFSREDDALCRVRRSVLVPAFIMTTTKKKTKKNGELNCISNAFCMLLRTYHYY